MKIILTLFLVFFSCFVSGQSYLLHKGEQSNILPLGASGQDEYKQASFGFMHSENGKYDWGLKIDVSEHAKLVVTSPFYRYYFFNARRKSGLVIASSLGYSLLMAKSGRVRIQGVAGASVYYRIAIGKVRILPELNYIYTRRSEEYRDRIFRSRLDRNSSYAVATTFSYRMKQGFITLIPRLHLDIKWNRTYALGLNFQWVKGA